jgi:hypothetical protein
MARLRTDYWWHALTALFVALFLIGGTLSKAVAQEPGEAAEAEKAVKEVVIEEAQEPEKPQLNASVDMLSQYVWRGIGLSRGSVALHDRKLQGCCRKHLGQLRYQ